VQLVVWVDEAMSGFFCTTGWTQMPSEETVLWWNAVTAPYYCGHPPPPGGGILVALGRSRSRSVAEYDSAHASEVEWQSLGRSYR